MKNEVKIVKEKALGDKVLADLCIQLSALLKAGIPLVSAFDIIIKHDRSKGAYLNTYSKVKDMICDGGSFSNALKSMGGKFPDLMVHMVSSSEHTGNLSVTMSKLGDYFIRQDIIKTNISNALVYPKIIFTIVAAVLILLTTFVIPRFFDVFSNYENIPNTTKFLFSFSQFVSNNLLLIILVVICIYLSLKLLFKTRSARIFKDKLKVKFPYLGDLYRTIYTSRFADTFSSLHSCGVDVTTAVKTSCYTIDNTYLEKQFKEVINKITYGVPVSEAIYFVDGLNGKLADIIKIGEESGELEKMLDIVSENLNKEAQSAISKMLKLIEPAVILLTSMIILIVILSVMIPMLDSYSLLENSIGI